MAESKADIILHPVRMRIVQALVSGQQLTAQAISARLPDVPPASLYRHLKKLTDAAIVEVAAENRVRGAVEKIYTLPEQKASADEAILKAAPDEQMNYFLKFMAAVLDDFERYVSQPAFDFEEDAAGYRQVSVYATDEELHEFMKMMNGELLKLIGNQPGDGRRLRTLSTVLTTKKD